MSEESAPAYSGKRWNFLLEPAHTKSDRKHTQEDSGLKGRKSTDAWRAKGEEIKKSQERGKDWPGNGIEGSTTEKEAHQWGQETASEATGRGRGFPENWRLQSAWWSGK